MPGAMQREAERSENSATGETEGVYDAWTEVLARD